MRQVANALAIAAVCLVLGAAPMVAQDAPEATPSPSTTIGEPADDGARIVAVENMGPRRRDLTIESPAVGTVQVRLLLPAAFDAPGSARFPVLYLLHGGGGEYRDWTEETDVAAITAPTDLLVAMPSAATSGAGGRMPEGGADRTGEPPDWERFHVVELQELLERNWSAGQERAIGGLSLGGYGAMMSAANNPDLFDAVASFSGALDLSVVSNDSAEVQAVIEQATETAEAAGWNESNPINIVSSLDGIDLYISYGNGEPGPLDSADAEHDALEEWIGKGGDNFVAALAEADIPATVNAYGAGTHSWPYWERELRAALPLLLDALGQDSDA